MTVRNFAALKFFANAENFGVYEFCNECGRKYAVAYARGREEYAGFL